MGRTCRDRGRERRCGFAPAAENVALLRSGVEVRGARLRAHAMVGDGPATSRGFFAPILIGRLLHLLRIRVRAGGRLARDLVGSTNPISENAGGTQTRSGLRTLSVPGVVRQPPGERENGTPFRAVTRFRVRRIPDRDVAPAARLASEAVPWRDRLVMALSVTYDPLGSNSPRSSRRSTIGTTPRGRVPVSRLLPANLRGGLLGDHVRFTRTTGEP